MSCFVKEGGKSGLRNFQFKETVEHANNDVQQAIGNMQLELCSKVKEQICKTGNDLHEAVKSYYNLEWQELDLKNVYGGGGMRTEICGFIGRKRYSKRRQQRGKHKISIQRWPKSQDNVKEIRREKVLIANSVINSVKCHRDFQNHSVSLTWEYRAC